MKARAFERMLLRDGCVLVRTRGDHRVWKLPSGNSLVVPHGGKHAEVKVYLLARYAKLREQNDTKENP